MRYKTPSEVCNVCVWSNKGSVFSRVGPIDDRQWLTDITMMTSPNPSVQCFRFAVSEIAGFLMHVGGLPEGT